MSANPYHDGSDNPYAEGGSGSSATASSSRQLWFCHQCSADFHLMNADTQEPVCPSCHGSFVEKIEDSIDDPRAFDRPDNTAVFAMFGGRNDATTQPGNAQSPFLQLMQQLSNAGFFPMPVNHLQNPPAQSGSGPQGLSPQASSPTEREAGRPQSSQSPPSATATPSVLSPQEQAHEDNANQSSNSSGGFRTGPVTFTWSNTTTTNRPPPHTSSSITPNEDATDGDEQTQVPIRNLASFLHSAFAPAPGNDNQQSPRPRAQSAPQPQFPNDPLAAMLSQMAANFGVPLGVNNGSQNGGAQQGQSQTQSTQNTQQGQQQSQAGQPGFSRVIFGTPGQNGGAVFTFTAGNGGQGRAGGMQGLPFPLAMLTGLTGQGEGRMGDYVFSQGAMDNIITELMNQANGRYGPQPAPEQMINDLPRVKMTSDLVSAETVQDCAVCKDDFQVDEEAIKLPCSHLFHTDCITPWLERNGTCPVCRHQLVEQPEPPRGPTARFGAQDASSTPVSPSLPRSPPIAGGSSMPSGAGGFFSSIFNAVTGNRADASGSRSQGTSQGAQGNTQSGRTQQQNDTTQPDFDLDLD